MQPLLVSGSYGIHLLFEEPPVVDLDSLLESLQDKFPGITRSPAPAVAGVTVFAHAPSEDVAMPPVAMVLAPTAIPDGLEAALQQTRGWRDARETVSRARWALPLFDGIATAPPPHVRMNLFHGLVLSVLQVTQPCSIFWVPAQRVLHSSSFNNALLAGDFDLFVHAVVNVRSFRSGPDTTLMDTVGLGPFGLPDFECHFRFDGVDANAMAAKLYNYAFEVFREGDVFRTGDTVEGFVPGERWSCRREAARAAPARTVIRMVAGSIAAPGEAD
jgi:hypothetical protein